MHEPTSHAKNGAKKQWGIYTLNGDDLMSQDRGERRADSVRLHTRAEWSVRVSSAIANASRRDARRTWADHNLVAFRPYPHETDLVLSTFEGRSTSVYADGED